MAVPSLSYIDAEVVGIEMCFSMVAPSLSYIDAEVVGLEMCLNMAALPLSYIDAEVMEHRPPRHESSRNLRRRDLNDLLMCLACMLLVIFEMNIL